MIPNSLTIPPGLMSRPLRSVVASAASAAGVVVPAVLQPLDDQRRPTRAFLELLEDCGADVKGIRGQIVTDDQGRPTRALWSVLRQL